MARDLPWGSLFSFWEYMEHEYGAKGQALLGRADRYYLLARLCRRHDVLHPWLFERCRMVEKEPDGCLDLWAREHYKLFRVDEPVPTPQGWKAHGDLVPGDDVFGPDGKPCKVIAVTEVFQAPPQHLLTFDDGTQIVAGDDHLWEVERRSRKRIPGTFAKDGIGKRKYRECVLMSTAQIAEHDHAQDNRLAVRVNAPLQLPDVELPVHPYVLGLWLGDGTSNGGSITCGDPEVFDEIERCGYVVGKDKTPTRNSQYRNVGGLSTAMDGMGIRGCGAKDIPAQYLRGSENQRRALLQGLMDTDGHCNTRGTATFVNTNERLVDGVVELCNSLGLKPSKRQHIGAYEGEPYPYWQVSFQAYKEQAPFRLARKLARCKDGSRPNPRRYIVSCERVEPKPGSCIQVDRPDGLYLAGKAMLTTHNSTLITYAGILQEIVLDPEITIGIFSHTKPVARKFLLQIKLELESNERLKEVYPDVLYRDPKNESPRWSEEKGLVVRRRTNPKEATLEAHGLVDGQPTGAHFRLRVYDDVVTRESVSTPEQVQKTTDAWALSDNLGARGHDGRTRAWHIGTRYSFADSYQHMLDKKLLKPRIFAATDSGELDGTPVFLLSEVWEEKKLTQGPAICAAQMLQNPAAGNEAMFKREWLTYIDIRPATLNVYIMCDPAQSRKKESDNTAIAVVGVDAQRNKYFLDGYRHKMSLRERWTAIKGLRKYWMAMPGVQNVKVGYERYGMQSDLEYFEDQMERDREAWEIVELAWPLEGPGSKIDRVQRLQPDFFARRFYLPLVSKDDTANRRKVRDAGESFRVFEDTRRRDQDGRMYSLMQSFIDEYVTFPFSVKKDLIDALSRIYDMDPVPPLIIDQSQLEPATYADGI